MAKGAVLEILVPDNFNGIEFSARFYSRDVPCLSTALTYRFKPVTYINMSEYECDWEDWAVTG